jgi:hypothetical protein
MAVPLSGQGMELAPGFPYRGQWIHKLRIFVFLPDADRDNYTTPQFTVHLNKMDDDWCSGFDAFQLASAIGITVNELLEANRERRLTLEQVWADTPNGEGATAKQYTFRVGEKQGSLIIKAQTQFGSA